MTEEEIFLAALAKASPQERAAFLDEACTGDGALRRRVEALLASAEQAGDFLEQPPGDVLSPSDSGETQRTADDNTDFFSNPVSSDSLDTVIGPYRLLEKIGEGGMGVVYMAQQDKPIRRLVAVKVIKPGMDSRRVINRFEAERQALALMNHPNIAAVFDAGMTRDHRPYFVMELVKGVPITQFCDENKLTPRQRLELFIPVCQAIQHAHQKGIIHRDIKPSNVLIACYDDKPVPKVIDFGVAKALGPALIDDTPVTNFGGIVGTLNYMSPEQATFNALDIDTRSDVYALGALLYELLTGEPPLKEHLSQKVAIQTLLDSIRDQEPLSPSTRLSKSAGTLPALATRRGMDATDLTRSFRGELDLIVMKALHKDRKQRYESAGGLARDIDRFLVGDAVEACPPTWRYRTSKFLRRHKGPVIAASLLILALVAGIIGTSWGLARALESEAETVAALAKEKKAKTDSERAREELIKEADRTRRAYYLGQIGWAHNQITMGNVARARAVLETCPQDLRHIEWHALKASLDTSSFTVGWSEDPVLTFAFTADGRHLVTGNVKGTIQIRDVSTGKITASFAAHDALVSAVAIGDDKSTLATGSTDGTIRLWSNLSGNASPIRVMGHLGTVRALRFLDGGKRLLSVSENNEVRIWDLSRAGRLEQSYSLPGFSPELSPSGSRIVTDGGLYGSKSLWDVRSGVPMVDSYKRASFLTMGMAMSPDDSRLVGCDEDYIKIWDTHAGGEPIMKLWGHNVRAIVATFSGDGKMIFSGGMDGTIHVWNAEQSGPPIATLRGHEATVLDIASNADGTMLVSRDRMGIMKVWKVQLGIAATFTLDGYGKGNWVEGLAMSPDEKHIISSGSVMIRTWQLQQPGPMIKELIVDRSEFAVDKTATRIAAIGRDDRLLIWDFANGQSVPLGTHKSLTAVAFSPDGSRVASGGWDKIVRIWDSHTPGPPKLTLSGHVGDIRSLAFSPDGTRICSASWDKTIKVWDSTTEGSPLLNIAGHTDGVNVARYSPDGTRIVSASADGTVRIWNADNGGQIMKLPAHSRNAKALAISHDGLRIISGGWDKTVKIWAPGGGTEPIVTLMMGSEICSVGISKDQRTLIAGDKDGKIKVWSNPVSGHD